MEFKWLNQSSVRQTKDRIEILAPAQTDFFCGSIDEYQEGSTAWLQVCRVGNNFAFHYSVDGVNFFMMRYFHLPANPAIKVGLLAQAPVGNGGIRVYENLSIENKTVKNIRAGK